MARALFHNRISKLNWYLWYNKLCTLPIVSASWYLLHLLPVAIGEHELDSELSVYFYLTIRTSWTLLWRKIAISSAKIHAHFILIFWIPKHKMMLSLILYELYNIGSYLSTVDKCYTFMILFEIQCHWYFIFILHIPKSMRLGNILLVILELTRASESNFVDPNCP